MSKSKKKVYASLEEEVLALRKECAGLRGYNGTLSRENASLQEALREVRGHLELWKKGYLKLEDEICRIKGLPWYKRIFKI